MIQDSKIIEFWYQPAESCKSKNRSGQKGPQEVIQFNLPAEAGSSQSTLQRIVARGFSSEEDSTTTLGQCFICTGKNFFLMFQWKFLCITFCSFPLVLQLGTTEKSLTPSSWMSLISFSFSSRHSFKDRRSLNESQKAQALISHMPWLCMGRGLYQGQNQLVQLSGAAQMSGEGPYSPFKGSQIRQTGVCIGSPGLRIRSSNFQFCHSPWWSWSLPAVSSLAAQSLGRDCFPLSIVTPHSTLNTNTLNLL